MAAPFREAEFDLMFGEGISREGSLLDMAELHGLMQKSGTWFSYEGERLGQGRENVKRYLKENTDVAEKIELQVRQAVGLADADPEEEETGPTEEEKQEA
jgi:recombination protein RecA